jgi:hypothetical protein
MSSARTSRVSLGTVYGGQLSVRVLLADCSESLEAVDPITHLVIDSNKISRLGVNLQCLPEGNCGLDLVGA